MLLPESGGSIAMLGSLAGHAAARVKNPRKINIALGRIDVERVSDQHQPEPRDRDASSRRRRTRLAQPEDLRDFDFGSGPRSSFPVTLPDLVTIHQATGVPDVETFVQITAGSFATAGIKGSACRPQH
ncbi:hypothetical protein [Rhizobium ruizarguesonis]|jgi:hypothetical protein|uniref:hypothetical protein n=1 Tax=Rhizobium ruizarguesonis TaxID=2081791 RepID=UPI00048046C6|nr:hypothetical protein [Rhizobium ruizarguesonis]UFW99122.1 hypothetical protein RlegTA1_34725 [Rhizobium ruizarguesonis]WSH24828.1 hypothetical protein U8Q07_32485 [Rhizobium ruizarguesonis]WSH36531.1 hypothetical protein U8P70_25615 [Rhizobium ruizarguesonis]WSH60686.1 hypothetical protein U8P68_25980 [Rhizobium ruizarguesonis]